MTGRSRARIGAIVLLVLAMIPLTAVLPASAGDGPAIAIDPIVKKDVAHDLSAPLRSMALETASTGGTGVVPLLTRPLEAARSARGTGAPDPVVQSSAPTVQMPATGVNFEGIARDFYLPPDANSDVGPNHIVETVNVRFQIFDKTGSSLFGPANINTLFSGLGGACETTNNGDPIVLYDAAADRWMISQFALPNIASSAGPFFQCIALSQTPDPTGAWYRYAFDMGRDLNDYSKFGVWSDGYYMTDNEFTPGVSWTFAGVGVYAFDRAAMLTGAPANLVYFHLPDTYFGLIPGDIDGSTPPPAGSPNPIVMREDNLVTDYIDIWEFHVDWATPAFSTLAGPTQLVAAPFDADLCGGSRDCIPQPGTAVGLDSLADMTMYRLAYRNFGTHESLAFNFTVDVNGADHAGIRWTELRKTSGAWSNYQQGTYAPDTDHRWMGSIAQDHDGNIALGYSVSSSSTYPSIRYAGRLATDPLGVLSQGEATMIAGTGSQTSSSHRWGDYTSMMVDPSDDCTFWYTNQYYSETSVASWRTRIGSFRFPSCLRNLTVSTVGTGSVTSDVGGIDCPGTCAADYINGTNVQLTAHPAPGWVFTGWSGGCSGDTNPCSVSMTQARTVTATFAACTYEPDAQIRGGPADLTYVGNDVYNHNGFGQTVQRQVRPGFGDQYNIKMENDGNCVDSYFVHGAGSSTKFKVTYWDGPLNVTPDVVAGTFATPALDPGESATILAFIYAKRGVRQGTTVTDLISVTSPGTPPSPGVPVWDVVGARLRVDRRAGDFGSQFPIP